MSHVFLLVAVSGCECLENLGPDQAPCFMLRAAVIFLKVSKS
jgi:hypothetical protein